MRGRQITSSGYVLVAAPGHPAAQANGYVLEHRRVWHDERGPIPKGHIVHHVDGDKQHNLIDNLVCMSRGDHAIEHSEQTRPILDAHQKIGLVSLIAYNTTVGPWNKGTAKRVLLSCVQCGRPFEREAHEARRRAASRNAPCCSLRCAALLGHSRRAKATGGSNG